MERLARDAARSGGERGPGEFLAMTPAQFLSRIKKRAIPAGYLLLGPGSL